MAKTGLYLYQHHCPLSFVRLNVLSWILTHQKLRYCTEPFFGNITKNLGILTSLHFLKIDMIRTFPGVERHQVYTFFLPERLWLMEAGQFG